MDNTEKRKECEWFHKELTKRWKEVRDTQDTLIKISRQTRVSSYASGVCACAILTKSPFADTLIEIRQEAHKEHLQLKKGELI